MKILRKIFLYLLLVCFSIVISGYLFFLYALPPIINNSDVQQFLQDKISDRIGYTFLWKGFKYDSYPNLSVGLKVDNINAKNSLNNKDVFNISKVRYSSKIFSIKPKEIFVEKIFIDCQNLSKDRKDSSQYNINLDLLTLINVERVFVQIDKNTILDFKNIKSEKYGSSIKYILHGILTNNNFRDPFYIGENGVIIYNGKGLQFSNYSVRVGGAQLLLSGGLSDLFLRGKNLPAGELKEVFLKFYHLKNPTKKNFMENFNNLSGKIDVDLEIIRNNYFGKCVLNNGFAHFSKLNIPVKVPKMVFVFKNRSIVSKTFGFVENEPVQFTFNVKNMFAKNLLVYGDIKSKFSGRVVTKYIPDLKILGKAEATVLYKSQNQKSNIKYILELMPENDISYKQYKLGNGKRYRVIEADTVKIGDTIKISKYLYSIVKNGKKIPYFIGVGQLSKYGDAFEPDYITLKTLKKIPLVAVSFLVKNYVEGGFLSSDLRYDFRKKALKGYLDLEDVHHKDFLFLKNVHLEILGKNLLLTSHGTFFDSPIDISVIADNNFKDSILVHNVNIHLNKFLVKREKYTSLPEKYINFKGKNLRKRNYDIDIETGKIVVDNILHSKFHLKNVKILGNLRDDVVNFVTEPIDYAKGDLIAVGEYNIANHSSEIEFCATDIDSNYVATSIFNLPDYVKGVASASLFLKTKNKLNDVKAEASFIIENGSLPKIGSTEFMFKKPKKFNKFKFLNIDKIKFSLSKITNIDFSTRKEPTQAYIIGDFKLDNELLKDAQIYFTSDFVSMFIEGFYNIDSQYANLYIWGRHNKTAEKKIKILKIPFTLLYKIIFRPEKTKNLYQDKISKIPPINMKFGDIESIFRVFIEGNLNTDNLKVNMKDLK